VINFPEKNLSFGGEAIIVFLNIPRSIIYMAQVIFHAASRYVDRP
jgi:hypothetical protein